MTTTASTTQEQEFYYRAPEAASVQLVGDFTHWQKNPIQMHKRSDGTWRAAVALTPGTHHYRFLVDGAWCDDPDCTIRVPNAFGSQNMVREVRASATPMAQTKPAAATAKRRRAKQAV